MRDDEVHISVNHLLRHDSGRMAAVLTRIFGFHRIDQIEDSIQEALLKALKTWPYKGIPENSTAWLIQVAKNHLLDQLRKENKSVAFDEEVRETDRLTSKAEERIFFDDEISEDQLRIIFACCHPSIPKDSQIALTLKTVGGFNNHEIASAFLAKRTAVDKILVRAKQKLKKHRKHFDIPKPDMIAPRLEAVLKVIYLMFNEGYMASEGDNLVKKDLCFEAIRLVNLLASFPVTDMPRTNALAALLHFQGSRLAARSLGDGIPVLLSEQDRSEWDRGMIAKGVAYLRASAKGDEVTEYHLQAEIASHHALAESFESTDWSSILECYESLYAKEPSPIVAVNKAYSLSRVVGPRKGLQELSGANVSGLEEYYPYYIVVAELQAETGDLSLASESYKRALRFITNSSVRAFVENKIRLLEPKGAGIR